MKKKQSPEEEVKETSQTDTPNQEQKLEADKKELPSDVLKKTKEELAAANDKYLRLYAEFENFRRRTGKEKLDLLETASEEILKKLLPILDDFERALEALQQENVSTEATLEGIKLIHDKLLHLLQQVGVSSMPLAQGEAFDTSLHEAVTQLLVEDKTMQGKVVDVIEKGYLLKGKVLRFAKVVTGV